METQREVWFERAGAPLFALDAGSGPRAVVFMHGGLADHRAALLQVGPLAAAFRVLTPDMRGSGRSHYHAPLHWDQLADDVIALLDHAGIERAAIGGASMGSGVALRCALRHPRRIAGLILSALVYPGEDRGLSDAQEAAMRAIGEVAERVGEHGVEAMVPLFERLPAAVRERAVAMARSFDSQSVLATGRFLTACSQPIRSLRELNAITAPVLLIPGGDPEHPPELAALYAAQLRNASVAEPTPQPATSIASFCDGLSF